ncbi:hypothetical protein FZW96_03505 [Bacillus sp. BGMRC 2118]|nr:hypothetical protein FZW96_03505 [Bacillus sp. BGMRC 2118]
MFHILFSLVTLCIGLLIGYIGLFLKAETVSIISYTIVSSYCFYLTLVLLKTRNKTRKDRLNDWAQTRKKGVFYVIFFKGMVERGIPLGLINWTFNSDYEEGSLLLTLVYFLIMVLGGAFTGWFIWANMEREYEEYSSGQTGKAI